MTQRRLLLPLAAVLSLALAGSAQALSISAAIATTGSNTANGVTSSLTNYNENISSVSLTNAGGSTADLVGNSVSAQGRYASNTAADGGAFTSSSRNPTHAYQITFTITAPVWVTYDVSIDTSRIGALTRVDDGNGNATASISAITGTVNAVANPSLALAGVALNNASTAVNTPFSQASPTIALTGLTGNQVITLAFTWTSSASGSSSFTGPDEVAVRLGMNTTGSAGSGTTADDYPGVGSRTIANDGHFSGITATITAVPEPGTVLLLGAGLAGLAVHGRRRAD